MDSTEAWHRLGARGSAILLALTICVAGASSELDERTAALLTAWTGVVIVGWTLARQRARRSLTIGWPLAQLVLVAGISAVAPRTAVELLLTIPLGFLYTGMTLGIGASTALIVVGAVALVIVKHESSTLTVATAGLSFAVWWLSAVLPAGLIRRLRDFADAADREKRTLEATQVSLVSASAQFRQVFAASPVGISLSDEQGHFVEVNDALLRLVGRPRSEVLGRTSAWMTHPDDVLAPRAGADDGDAEGVTRIEKRYVRPDGTIRWGWLTLVHVPGPDGETWTLAHVQDITERKQSEIELSESRNVLAHSAAIARAAQTGTDVRPVVIDALRSLANASTASLVEPLDRDHLSVTHSSRPELVGTIIELDGSTSATAHVWQTGEQLLINHADGHPLVNVRLLNLVGSQAYLWTPVIVNEQPLALLSMTWDDAVSGVTPEQLAIVSVIAEETGAALQADHLRTELERASTVDLLTGLANRRGWEDLTARMASDMDRMQLPMVVAIIDLDRFKAYNDDRGHLVGDELLAQFADALRTDLREHDIVARWGGEEFTVALGQADRELADEVLARLLRVVPDGQTCSIGYAVRQPSGSITAALAEADHALYQAKNAGRNRVTRAHPPVRGLPAADQPR